MQRDAATEAFRPLQTDDPPVVAGYRLAARLGAGGMGRVYLSPTPGGRPVALPGSGINVVTGDLTIWRAP
ncbi:hypothetical protein ACFVJI_03700 [Streptomyces sp. NPDC127584]|uniref:hypothetical protein n=1 Tax=Streptomyces sp. NPDC127584 TaxID=3345403 RepID=UPI00363AA553